MPISLAEFKLPPSDNGRGLTGYPGTGWKGGDQGIDYWVAELQSLGIRWFRVIDDLGDSLPLCQKLIAAGIFPIVRIVRRDLPPNDIPQPNPGHLSAREEMTIKKLIDVGVLYFETNTEPDMPSEWKQSAIPGNYEEAAKLVALNWLFDARFILEAGGYPGLPAVSSGSAMDLMGALASLGRQDILLDGCWIAVHNMCHNRPLNFPGDRVTQHGTPLEPHEYDMGPWTNWAWWDTALGHPNTLEEVNQLRMTKKNAGQVIGHDHAAFREYEYFDALARRYLGRSIPIITTEGGYQVGRRMDPRYPRITPTLHAELTVAMFEFMQRDAPEYYFANCAWVMVPTPQTMPDAWYSDFWDKTLRTGAPAKSEYPPIRVPDVRVGSPLPVVAAVKAMPSNPRRAPRITPPTPAVVMEPATLRPLPPPPPGGEESVYLAQHGDTLASIARKFGASVVAIASANGLAENSRIFAGQRLVIPAAAFVSTASPKKTAPPPPPFPPRPTQMPPAPPKPPRAPGLAPLDPRLAALNVKVEPAAVQAGETYWKLVRAEYQDPNQSGGEHHIIYTVLDDKGKPVLVQRVFQGIADIQADSFTDAFGQAKMPMWEPYYPDSGEAGPYSAWVGGYPSDKVVGMGMPSGMSVNFKLTWQKSVR